MSKVSINITLDKSSVSLSTRIYPDDQGYDKESIDTIGRMLGLALREVWLMSPIDDAASLTPEKILVSALENIAEFDNKKVKKSFQVFSKQFWNDILTGNPDISEEVENNGT